MGKNTLSFALPQSMRSYINVRVATGHYGNTSEYIRDLVRKDQADNAKPRTRARRSYGNNGEPAAQSTLFLYAKLAYNPLGISAISYFYNIKRMFYFL